MTDLEKTLKIAEKAYEKSLELIDEDFKTHIKEHDNSPVTDVDLAMNSYIVSLIEESFPGDPVIGEESPMDNEEALAGAWYIDPIDGTKELIKGNGEWAIHIGRCENFRPSIGVVVHPTKKLMYYASLGEGAFQKNLESGEVENMQTRKDAEIKNSVIVKSRSFNTKKIDKIQSHLGIEKSFPQGSLGLKVCQIAAKKADLYFNLSNFCKYWDICAPEIILKEAGGSCLTLDGEEILYNNPAPYGVGAPLLASAHEDLARDIIAKLEPFRPKNS